MDEELYEIKKIGYGLLSDDEIRNMSVCEVYNSKLSVANNDEMVISHEDGVHFFDNSASKLKCNTVYDEAMGNINPEKKCQTCGLIGNKCAGHFGHIELPYPKVHTLFKKEVCNFLNIFCFNCNRLLFTKDIIHLKKINLFTGYNRYLKIVAEAKKSKYCYNCETYHNTIKFAADKDIFYIDYKKEKGATFGVAESHEDAKAFDSEEKDIKSNIMSKVQFQDSGCSKRTKKKEQELDTLYIKKIFDNILDEDVTLLGLNVKNIHPKFMVKSVIPVIPISARPPVHTDDNICDDDTTTQYIEIVKLKNILENEKISEFDKLENINKLKYRIDTLFCNSKDKAKHTSNSNPVKSISSRLGQKNGLIRCNIMGKRCNQTGRTVAGPDTSLKSDQIGVPAKMANILTYPVRVAEYNKDILEKLVNDNRAKRIIKNTTGMKDDGVKDIKNPNMKRRIINVEYALNVKGTALKYNDVVIRERVTENHDDYKATFSRTEPDYNEEEIIIKNPHNFKLTEGDRIIRNGEEINDIVYPKKRYIKLEMGDIVERYLLDGDIIFINRQPTLWKGSMIAQKAVISRQKNLTVNLSICRSFNLDMDGKLTVRRN